MFNTSLRRPTVGQITTLDNLDTPRGTLGVTPWRPRNICFIKSVRHSSFVESYLRSYLKSYWSGSIYSSATWFFLTHHAWNLEAVQQEVDSGLFSALSTFNYGFDNKAFATTQAMGPFARKFGYFNEETQEYALQPEWLSLFNSLNYIGFAAGVLIGSPISARFGRRWCMFGMSLYALITATIAVTSQTKEQIIAARILNYVYVGIELSVCPVYQSEIVPTPARGFIVGTYQLSLVTGGFIINIICRGTSELDDNRAWRIPLGMFYIVPSIVATLVFFVPESPRWLLLKDKYEEARHNLGLLRSGTKSEEEIDEEFFSLRTALEQETEQGTFAEMWKGINLKRTVIVLFVNFFQQATGQAFASQYGPIYIKSLGTVNPFNMSILMAGVNIFVIIICLLLVDKVGRKRLLIVGAVVQLLALFAMGGVGATPPLTAAKNTAIVGLIVIFYAGFEFGWAPLTYVVTTEIMALRLRDITARCAFLVNVLINFAVNFSVPYLIFPPVGLNAKVGFIFGSIAVCAVIFTVLFVPECKGKSLEQIDIMFNEGVPLRKFGSYDQGIKPETAVLTSRRVGKAGSVSEHYEVAEKDEKN